DCRNKRLSPGQRCRGHKMNAPVFRCQAPDCTNLIQRKSDGRPRRFCSDKCRKAVSRISDQPEDFKAPPTVYSETCPKRSEKVQGSQWPKAGKMRDIVAPRDVIQAEVIAGRDWEEVVSSSGVVCYISRGRERALRDHDTP